MLTLQSVLRLREDQIVAKVIDGEAIIINLANGVYYSMGNAGALIWELVAEGHSLEAVAAALCEAYDIDRDRARADVIGIATKLVEEQLVRVQEPPTPAQARVSAPTVPKLAYRAPQLDIFRDIGHLVALDPPMPGLKDLPWKGPTDG